MDSDRARTPDGSNSQFASGCLKLILITAASIAGATALGYAAKWLM